MHEKNLNHGIIKKKNQWGFQRLDKNSILWMEGGVKRGHGDGSHLLCDIQKNIDDGEKVVINKGLEVERD